MHVTRLSPETTIAEMLEFLNQHSYDVSIEKINSKQPEVYSSFKIILASDLLDQVMSPTFWPEGVAVNRFFTRHRQLKTNS